jgi:hypothetical protein
MKPWILVDVDGVLNPDFRCHPPYCHCHAHWLRRKTYPGGFKFTVVVNPQHGPMLTGLAADTGGELAWGSTWEHHANEWIAPLVGLPSLPAGVTHGRSFKADTLIPWCDGRPWVWFDDDDTELYQADAIAGDTPHLTVWVEPTAGLTEAHIATAREWLLANGGT